MVVQAAGFEPASTTQRILSPPLTTRVHLRSCGIFSHCCLLEVLFRRIVQESRTPTWVQRMMDDRACLGLVESLMAVDRALDELVEHCADPRFRWAPVGFWDAVGQLVNSKLVGRDNKVGGMTARPNCNLGSWGC